MIKMADRIVRWPILPSHLTCWRHSNKTDRHDLGMNWIQSTSKRNLINQIDWLFGFIGQWNWPQPFCWARRTAVEPKNKHSKKENDDSICNCLDGFPWQRYSYEKYLESYSKLRFDLINFGTVKKWQLDVKIDQINSFRIWQLIPTFLDIIKNFDQSSGNFISSLQSMF